MQNLDIKWPIYYKKILDDETTKIAIQINGKKRGIIDTEKGIEEEKLFKLVMKDEILKKYVDEKIIKRKIFISNKLLNIIL